MKLVNQKRVLIERGDSSVLCSGNTVHVIKLECVLKKESASIQFEDIWHKNCPEKAQYDQKEMGREEYRYVILSFNMKK